MGQTSFYDRLRAMLVSELAVLNSEYEAGKDMEKEIREFSNARMAEYKWICVIKFVDAIPKTISDKICKAALGDDSLTSPAGIGGNCG